MPAEDENRVRGVIGIQVAGRNRTPMHMSVINKMSMAQSSEIC